MNLTQIETVYGDLFWVETSKLQLKFNPEKWRHLRCYYGTGKPRTKDGVKLLLHPENIKRYLGSKEV